MTGALPVSGGRKISLPPETGIGGQTGCINRLVKLTLILLVISSPLTTRPLCLVHSSHSYYFFV